MCGIGTQATPIARLKRWVHMGSGLAAYPDDCAASAHRPHPPHVSSVGRAQTRDQPPCSERCTKGRPKTPFLTYRNPSPLKEPHNRVFVVVQVRQEHCSTFRPVPNKPPGALLNLWPVSTMTRQEHKELNLWVPPSHLGQERERKCVSKNIYSIPHLCTRCQYPWDNWRGRVYEIPLGGRAATSYSVLLSRAQSSSIVLCDTQFSPFACPASAQVV